MLDNGFFKAGFLAVSIGGLLMVWSGGASENKGSRQAATTHAAPTLDLNKRDQKSLARVSSQIDAALRKQMRKLSGRIVNLLTVGPSPSQLESATIRALADLFTKVKIRSISDLPGADALVKKWRQDTTSPPQELIAALGLGDLTVVQWLESKPEGLLLHTWYVKDEVVMAQEVHPWGDGTLPQVTVDKLHRVILDPDLRIDG